MSNEVKDNVCSFDNLYKAMRICKSGVNWKDSVAGYVKNGLTNCLNLQNSLYSNQYKIDKYTVFKVYEPKERVIVSTRIKDRVFQRSLCDNYLTKAVGSSFIYDNCACQVDKGTDFVRNRLKTHLHKYYRHHGAKGYVLKCDLSNFFGSTPHTVAKEAIAKRAHDDWAINEVFKIIDSFNQGEDPEVGLGLGSQVTQLIELSVLDDMDHYIKEKLHIKHYIRYMDDFILFHPDKDYLRTCYHEIERIIDNLGLTLNQKKTQIFPITQPIHFLGFSFKLTDSGKVIMTVLPKKVFNEKRKLRKMVCKAKNGEMTRHKVDECFESWKAHAQKGNSYHLIKNMEIYYANLWR